MGIATIRVDQGYNKLDVGLGVGFGVDFSIKKIKNGEGTRCDEILTLGNVGC